MRADDFDRTGSAMGNFLRCAAEQYPVESGSTVRAQHDQIGSPLGGAAEDGEQRIAFHNRRRCPEATGPQHAGHAGHQSRCLLTGLFHRRAELRSISVAAGKPKTGRDSPVPLQGVQNAYFGTLCAKLPDNGACSGFGKPGIIDGQQDFHVGAHRQRRRFPPTYLSAVLQGSFRSRFLD